MARICPALQQLLNTKEVSTTENLATTPRRKPIKWSVLGFGLPITATIERMNRRVGAGLPLATMAKHDGKHASGLPKPARGVKAAVTKAKTPKAQKVAKVKAKPKKIKVIKAVQSVTIVAPPTATAREIAEAANKAAGRPIAYAVTSKPKINLILVLDKSGSMDGLRRIAAATQLDAMMTKVRQEFDPNSPLQVVEFADQARQTFNGIVNNTINYPFCSGNTALNDGVVMGLGLAQISSLPSIIYVFTDGEENRSANSISTTKDNVTAALAKGNITLVGIGPKPDYFKSVGFPEGNILNWTGNAADLTAKVAPAVTRGVEAVATAVKQGKTKINHFFLDIEVKLDEVQKKCVDVTSTMERRNVQQGGVAIREYVEKHCKLYTYVDGAYFYKLVTREKLLKDRRIVISHRDDTTGKLYSGPMARTLLGLPTDRDIKVEPGSLGKWSVFVQSASPTRKTVKDTEFLWDKTATGNVKPTWTVGAKKPYPRLVRCSKQTPCLKSPPRAR